MRNETVFVGRDVQAALKAASDALNRQPDELNYGVLAEDRGFLGFRLKSVSLAASVAEERQKMEPGLKGPRLDSPPNASVGASAAVGAGQPDGRLERASAPVSAELAAGWVAVIQDLVSKAGLEVSAKRIGSEGFVVELDGTDGEFVREENGKVLAAVQYLVERMIRFPSGIRMRLESGDFRVSRDTEIVALAEEALERAAGGEVVWLEPMNPYERRLVHVRVGETAGMCSESEGDGFLKRIAVMAEGTTRPPKRRRGTGRRRSSTSKRSSAGR